ncbi:hypothetical protein SK128_026440 [Halocaridina rubra]|uniref:Uncharacterized protein n=1 Tax=Halocaridina rubra TaxID=373956 RepID=A0AAN8WLP8_HALRR
MLSLSIAKGRLISTNETGILPLSKPKLLNALSQQKHFKFSDVFASSSSVRKFYDTRVSTSLSFIFPNDWRREGPEPSWRAYDNWLLHLTISVIRKTKSVVEDCVRRVRSNFLIVRGRRRRCTPVYDPEDRSYPAYAVFRVWNR